MTNIFSYGRVYSRLSPDEIRSLGLGQNSRLLFLSKIYFYLFGYPDVASQRRYLTVEKLLHLKRNENVLDAGCGNGIYLQEFGERFGTTGVGVDARKNRIDNANKINRYLGGKNSFITSTLEKVNLDKDKFDKAICLEVLEHIYNDGLTLKRLSKNLVGGGLFVISIPMKGTALSPELENDPNFKPEKYEHVRSGYTESDIRKMASSAGLKVVLIKKYFFFVSRYAVKLQQFLYKKKLVLLNLCLSPVLLLISGLDDIFQVCPRGFMLVLKKI
jgi:2-polyprenyl-3-methyl-5-hydroxy-6-metoxy-1,4-benzoquinol methylase